MAKTQLFRLKVGSHSVGINGVGPDGKPTQAKMYRASDPNNNIVESEEDLARADPQKFERYDGPMPARNAGPSAEEPPSPPPPDEFSRLQAESLRAMPASQLRQRSELLRQQLEQMEAAAEEAEKAEKAAAKKAPKPDESEDEDDLEGMTVQQLRDTAEEDGVELKSDMRKDEIIKAIRDARKG